MDLKNKSEPFLLFADWLEKARINEPNDANAMALASVGDDGQPSLRMVLLKDHSEQGFVFYTNFESRKGRELQGHPQAGLLFHWKSLRRQIRIEGLVTCVSDREADAYFATRPRASQIGAWASEQSRPLEGRFALEKSIAFFTAKFGIAAVPRPAHWSGFRLVPQQIEFWQDREFRLHDRQVYRWQTEEQAWSLTALYP